jgi:spore coat polysaccharide biosynthesis predicted glycosyltransferase SpsG
VVVGDLPSRVRPASVHSREFSGEPALKVVTSPREASRAMAASQVAVSAAGTTAWELACLGVPAILWPMVKNQRPVASALDGRSALVCRTFSISDRAPAGAAD